MSDNRASHSANCLHLLFRPGADTLQSCLLQAQAGDSLVLLDTAVTLLLDSQWQKQLPAGVQAYAIDADLEAHGLSELQPKTGIALIDDKGWAGLVKTHTHCLSWK